MFFDEAGCDPAFVIRRVHADVLIGDLAVRRGWTASSYERVKEDVDCLAPRTHRADADACHLALLWQLVSRGPDAHA